MEYKRIVHIQTSGKYPIGIKIDISMVRDVTETESFEISDIATNIINKLHKNTLLSSELTQEEIRTQRAKLLALFDCPIYVKEIPNEYDGWIFPWYIVYTFKGPIKIGWRKRVINIDWTDSDIKEHGDMLFPEEDVTKSSLSAYGNNRFVHAWGYKKAKEYIDKLLNS